MLRKKRGCTSAELGFCISLQGPSPSLSLSGNIEQDADAGEGAEQRGAAGRDKRQREPFGRHQRQHHADIEERLEQDGGGDPEGYLPGKRVFGTEGNPKPAHAKDHEKDDKDYRA